MVLDARGPDGERSARQESTRRPFETALPIGAQGTATGTTTDFA
jgi:hypothetical protein